MIRFSSAVVGVPDPIGAVCLAWQADILVALDFGAPETRLLRLLRRRYGCAVALEDDDPGVFGDAARAYFEGALRAFEGCRLGAGGSPFQRLVWSTLRTIPAGETRSYGEIARAIGQPSASRAVGLANGANPINLAIPCHRVVGAQGALTGYGGGIERKRWLLAHEGTAQMSLFGGVAALPDSRERQSA